MWGLFRERHVRWNFLARAQLVSAETGATAGGGAVAKAETDNSTGVLRRKTQMKSVQQFVAVLICVALPCASFANDSSYHVIYDGGSVPDVKTGTGMKLFINPSTIHIMKDKTEIALIPAGSVTEISYGQDVHRRVGTAIGLAVVSLGIGALMALSKSKKHYIGVTWDDNGKKGGVAFQADKNEYRGILAGLEGITGKKAVDSDAMNVKN
jgi:hypothetical protein